MLSEFFARRLSLLALILPAIASAQDTRDPHAVQPERPTVATHAWTVAPAWVELESGVERDAVVGGDVVTTPTTIKIGLASHAQLGIAFSTLHPTSGASGAPGFGDLTADVKWRLTDDAPIVGAFALLPSVKFPTGSLARGTGTGSVDAGLLLISSHDIGQYSIDINAGFTRHGGHGENPWQTASLWTFSLGAPFVGPVGWTAECYGFPGTGGSGGQAPIVAFLTGPTFQLKTWLAADAGFIVPVSGPQPHALYAGGVWNIGRL